jgi:NADP-dependent 3-hydroxy acid dehydrogenase YdfG
VRTDWWVANGLTKEQSEQMYQENPYLEVDDIANAVIYVLGVPAHVQVRSNLEISARAELL